MNNHSNRGILNAILFILGIFVGIAVYAHRRVIKAYVTGEPMPEAPEWAKKWCPYFWKSDCCHNADSDEVYDEDDDNESSEDEDSE